MLLPVTVAHLGMSAADSIHARMHVFALLVGIQQQQQHQQQSLAAYE